MIYCCELDLDTLKIEYFEVGEDDDDTDEPDSVEYDQQFNRVYAETPISREAAFSLVLIECTKLYNKFRRAMIHLEKEVIPK